MTLESLLKLAETLKERVAVHDVALKGSEALTRYALIDPLLRELGWDTSDPSAVIPEYSSGSRRVDYALMVSRRPAVMVEAKKLGTPLSEDVLDQVVNYCMMEGTAHFAVTDGARWEIYKAYIPDTRIAERLILEFDLSADSPASVCLKALALWRPTVEIGSVAAAQPSVIEKEQPTVIPTPPPQPGDWRPLNDLDAKNTENQKPAEMLFPDGNRAELNVWVNLPLKTVDWLSTNGHLTRANCPIKSGRSRHVVHTSPNHGNGKAFKQAHDANGFYIEGNNSRVSHISNAVTVIERVGQDPSQFRVRFA